MRLARVSHVFYPDFIGNKDPFYSLRISMLQAEMGMDIEVYTWNKSGLKPREKLREGLVVNRLRGINLAFGGLLDDYPYLPALPGELRRSGFDVLHAHSHLFITTLQAVRTAERLGRPSVITIHGFSVKRNWLVDAVQASYIMTFGSWVLRHATRIVCLTKSDAKRAEALGCPRERIRVVPNPVDTNIFRPRDDLREGVRHHRIVWVGRFVPEKALECLVLAFKLLVDGATDVKLVLVGDGPTRGRISALVRKLGLSSHVSFTGPLSMEGVAEQLAKSSIFVLSSVVEGLPKALLEAMAAGKPVVVPDLPSLREVVEPGLNGLLFKPGDHEALAGALRMLLDDQALLMKMGAASRRMAVERYGFDGVVRQLNLVYEEALEEA